MITCLDIETSGLLKETDRLTCIGLGSETGLAQFAAFKPKDEAHMISDADKWMSNQIWSDETTLLTYNGRHFDLPFLKARGALYDITFDYLPSKHIDLLPFATKLNKTRMTKDMFLSKYLNMYVPRTCSGAWLARQYSTGKITMDGHLQNIQHNAQDVLVCLRAHEELIRFDDYNEYINEQMALPPI